MGLQQLINAAAQHRPVVLLDREVAPEVEDGDLPHAPADAFAADQAKAEVALASDLVVGAGLTDIHLQDATEATEQSKEKSDCYNMLWHNKMTFEVNPNKINRLRRTKRQKLGK